MSETLLKAARLAFQQFDWKIFPGSETTVFDGRGGSFNMDLRCQMALQIALEENKNGGWTFWRTYDGTFVAETWNEATIVHAPTKPDLLLKCVEATHDRA
jgi:hypothetical protein